MFGYLMVQKGELLVKEYETFRAYYCGLCKELAAYGVSARLLLNYDCTFLYLLASALCEERPQYQAVRCMVHPARKVPLVRTEGRAYAAALNVMLGYDSLLDHARDGRNPLIGAAAGAYRRAARKAARQYPAAQQAILQQLRALHELEQQGCADIDQAADAFASLLGALFLPLGEQKEVLKVLGYNIGRFVYLCDALDDLEKDEQRGQYNPFLQRFGPDKAAARQSAKFNLLSSASGAGMALDLLDLKRHAGILENIIYKGMPAKVEEILGKTPGTSAEGTPAVGKRD